MYSKYLGTVDNDWKYKWHIGGYCFHDLLPYEKKDLDEIIGFIKKDERPTVYFSLGSINTNPKQRDRFASLLFDICTENNYKLLISAGWWNVGAQLENKDNLFRMNKIIPHCLIFPHCSGIIHHGGAGTTHSASRSGRPQLVTPILLDQYYWSNRTKDLGVGPGAIKIKGISKKTLEQKVIDLVTNPSYKEKAHSLGVLIRNEGGLENICKHIESYQARAESQPLVAKEMA
jgi:UDP:flavonoid glycosyltransferase YjiC (YdhE family)